MKKKHSYPIICGALLLFAAACLASDAPKLPPLTTASGNPRLPGKFVWVDLVTDDVLTAQKFYTTVFGWTFNDYGGYIIGRNDDRPMCGMFQRPRPKDRVALPRWFGYISVGNVKRAQRTITKAGGRVLAEPKKMSDRGEQAVFADPEGTVFGVIKSSSGDPQDFKADPGDWIWIQLLSKDGPKAAEFYRKIAGYEIVENTATNRISDMVLTSGGYARGTVSTIRNTNSKLKPTWLPFVCVENVGKSLALAKQSGGTVLVEPIAKLMDGKVAVIADPTGAAVGIMEWPEALTKGEQ
jgi:predicted enzyme related to lactoylglutathione lyase